MTHLVFEIADGQAICPINGRPYHYEACLKIRDPQGFLAIEDVVTWVAVQRESIITAEELAAALSEWGRKSAAAFSAKVTVQHEPIDGVTLTVFATARAVER